MCVCVCCPCGEDAHVREGENVSTAFEWRLLTTVFCVLAWGCTLAMIKAVLSAQL